MLERIPLDDIADILGGMIHVQTVDGGDGPACFGADEIRNPGANSTRRLPPDVDVSRATRVVAGDVAVTAKGVLGLSAVVQESQRGAILLSDCVVVRLRSGVEQVSAEWLYAWTWTSDFRFEIERIAAGAAAHRVTPRGLGTIPIPVIPRADQARVGALTSQLESARMLAVQTASNLERLQRTEVDLALYEVLS